MTHPLTDKMCEELSCFYLSNLGDTGEGITQDMRASADWQLECDAEWWRIILNRMKILDPHAVDSLIEEFKRAMRPQQQEEI